MGFITNIIAKAMEFLSKINSQYVALFSVLVTIIIFIMNRHSELKYKKYEDKKNEYKKLIDLLSITFTEQSKLKTDKNGKLNKDMQKMFFDTGASLMLYASRKLYKEYVFFRDFATSEHMKLSKYYDQEMIMYIVAHLLQQIRKEVGLSNLNSISSNEALAFIVNDFGTNPIQKNKTYKMNYKIKMLKIELFFMNRFRGVFLHWLYYSIFMPVIEFVKCLIKYIFVLPIIHIFKKLFHKKNKIESN